MPALPHTCRFCNRPPFPSARALTQHLNKNLACKRMLEASLRQPNGASRVHNFMASAPILVAPSKQLGPIDDGIGQQQRYERRQKDADSQNDVSDDSVEEAPAFEDNDSDDDAHEAHNQVNQGPNSELLEEYKIYVERARRFGPMPRKLMDSVKLMHRLRRTKASLETYDCIMEWHLKVKGDMHEHESAASSPDFWSRKRVFDVLRSRYNMDKGYNNVTEMLLPCTNTKVNVVWNDAKKVLTSLLTDPRIKDDDYLFWDKNDPFAPPPSRFNYIADLNTGRSYTETHKELITDPTRQILLPVPMHIDSAATGQFVDLPNAPVKISLGIFTRKARMQAYTWGILGYLPKPRCGDSRGRRLLVDSGHMEASTVLHHMLDHEGDRLRGAKKGTKGHGKAQHMHSMLAKILESFVKLQDTGFLFDFHYRGITYKNVEFIPFVPFIKCDTEEADKLCGHYLARNGNVAQLCRCCCIPTHECDRPLAEYPLKTRPKIEAMVRNNDVNGLQNCSQQNIDNACYALRFGSHSRQSVHGACPIELLHFLLLGLFKYIKEAFFNQIGAKSMVAKEVDALAKEYATCLMRQSDREMPRFKFSQGIMEGKLMAKEYKAVLFLMLCVVKSTAGRKLLLRRPKFKEPGALEDWVLLLETLLEWETWLNSPKIMKKDLQKAGFKHRYLMYLAKRVGRRTEGMGFKLVKFHAILHLVQDIRNFGVPQEVDTGANESHHKPAKVAAKLTQKKKENFDYQTSLRLDEMKLLELAMLEFEGCCPWDYVDGYFHPPEPPKDFLEPATGGGVFKVFQEDNEPPYMVNYRQDGRGRCRMMVEQDFVDFIHQVQNAIKGYVPFAVLPVRTKHQRDRQVFRGDVSFMMDCWRDWIVIDWDDHGHLPGKAWGFVDLTELAPNAMVSCGGLDRLTPAACAIVESAEVLYGYEGVEHSDLFTPLATDVVRTTAGLMHKRRFYLADVEAIVSPAVVIPDIGGKPNHYWWVHPPKDWGELFIDWLNENDPDEVISDSEPENESNEESEEEDTSSISDSDDENNASGSENEVTDDETEGSEDEIEGSDEEESDEESH